MHPSVETSPEKTALDSLRGTPTRSLIGTCGAALDAGWRRMRRRFLGRGRRASAGLEAVKKRLEDLCAATEPSCVALARSVKALHDNARGLSEDLDSTLGTLRDGLGTVNVGGTDGEAETALASLSRGCTHTVSDLRRLQGAVSALRTLRRRADDIAALGRTLGAASLALCVEAARSPARSLAFASFVAEVRRVADSMLGIGRDMAAQAASIEAALIAVMEGAEQGLGHLQRIEERAAVELRKAAGKAQSIIDRAAGLVGHAQSSLRLLGTSADEALYHGQLGDLLRQKIEHVIAAVRSAGPSGPSAEMAALQAAHLLQIASEARDGGRCLAGEFSTMEGATQAVSCAMEALARTLTSGSTTFQEVSAGVAMVAGEGERGLHLRRIVQCETTRSLGRCQDLAAHVESLRTLNLEMRLLSLNAIIKAALLSDDGRALGAVSEHLHSLFRASTVLLDDTIAVINALSGMAADAAVAAEQEPTAREPAATRQGGPEGVLGALGALRDRGAERMDYQRRMLSRARETLEFLGGLASEAESLGAQLESTRTASCSPEMRPTDTHAIERCAQGYTSAGERRVHAAFASAPEGLAAAIGPARVSADDNVEIFSL